MYNNCMLNVRGEKMDINYINKLLQEGKSVKDIRKTLNIGEKTFQRKIKELGYKYNQKIK